MKTKKPHPSPRKEISVKLKLLVVLLAVQIPFCLLFLFTVRSARVQTNAHLASAQISSLDVFLESIQKEMNQVTKFMFIGCWSNEAFRSAGVTSSAAEANALLEPCAQEADALLEQNSDITAVIFYHRAADRAKAVLAAESASRSQQLEAAAGPLVEGCRSLNTGWEVRQIDGQNCLVRICGWGECYVIVVINLSELATNLRVNYNMKASIVFYQGDQALTDAFWMRGYGENRKTAEEGQDYYFAENNGHTYLVTEARLASLDLVCASEYQYSWSWLYGAAILLICVVLGTLTLGALYLRQVFFLPLDRLVQVMQTVRSGSAQARAPKSGSREFDRIGEIFNEMLDAVEALKIETYESQLAADKMKTNALRLQIRRHFFLNCLKNIYAMASSGETELVKQTTLLLSTNLRYMLDFKRDKVPLNTELSHCNDYIELQGIGQQHRPELRVSLGPIPKDFEVPPVSLLTMLENCCKYGVRQEEPLVVSITVRCHRMDGRNYVTLFVQDNGPGFSADMLQMLNNALDSMQTSGHIGYSNTLMRLRMLYGEEVQMLFSNHNGAQVEWLIPLPKAAAGAEEPLQEERSRT